MAETPKETTAERECTAYVRELDWDLYRVSELLGAASRSGMTLKDSLTGASGLCFGVYGDLWELYNLAFSLKAKDWKTDDLNATEVIDDLKSISGSIQQTPFKAQSDELAKLSVEQFA